MTIPRRNCDCFCDRCTGEATTTRDTTSGYCTPIPYCAACAAAWDKWSDNYDGPGDGYYQDTGSSTERDQLRDAGRSR